MADDGACSNAHPSSIVRVSIATAATQRDRSLLSPCRRRARDRRRPRTLVTCVVAQPVVALLTEGYAADTERSDGE